MTNKEKSAELASKYVQVFSCPLCNSPMAVTHLKSLICLNNHTFDFAKQGYVNMMTRSAHSHYDKKLFKARQKIIMESNLYTSLHQKISEVINEKIHASTGEIIILDAGCGEGSHLQRILDKGKNGTITGLGVDISKEGIRMAASNYKESIWLVGDLAHPPISAQSCHIILNILSPANYKDFKRILVSDGLIVKVVPRTNYLKELRKALFDDMDMKTYKNDETVSLFNQHFQLVNMIHLSYTKKLPQSDLSKLVQMSPLAWNSKKEQIDKFTNQVFSEITVDLDILVGVNRQTKEGEE
ncbi:methyltransferase domain-containing protein [Neobacillus sp. YIM B02564]|uniref:Methyltransferase domain-containing protein n=1 Tax=Neobacillus paridis TaxID=2803862 RepID=A0ABS1TUF4_9BACI|nr:methyltransferase domain-containing protein [Neobacillus paridis]MBL4954359.1 methyltransferase domain-containing protein [Neobacillus paridis]